MRRSGDDHSHVRCENYYMAGDSAERHAEEAIAFALSLAIRNSRKILFVCHGPDCAALSVFRKMISPSQLEGLSRGEEVEMLMGVQTSAVSFRALSDGRHCGFDGIVFGVGFRPGMFAAVDAIRGVEAVIHLPNCPDDIADWADLTHAAPIQSRNQAGS